MCDLNNQGGNSTCPYFGSNGSEFPGVTGDMEMAGEGRIHALKG
jgi:hypothetical protein